MSYNQIVGVYMLCSFAPEYGIFEGTFFVGKLSGVCFTGGKMELKLNAPNDIAAGTTLFEEGQAFDKLFVVIKGKVEVSSKAAKTVATSGAFLELASLSEGVYASDARTLEDCRCYVFQTNVEGVLDKVLSVNREFAGIAVYNMNKRISDLVSNFEILSKEASKVLENVRESYAVYEKIARTSEFRITEIPGLSELKLPDVEEDDESLNYYRESMKIPIDVLKSYYGVSRVVAICHMNGQAAMIKRLEGDCATVAEFLKNLLDCLVNAKGKSLTDCVIQLAEDLKTAGRKTGELSEVAAAIETDVTEVEALLNTKTRGLLGSGKAKLAKLSACFNGEAQSVAGEADAEAVDIETVRKELRNSLGQILEFSGYEEGKATAFKKAIKAFAALPDRNSSDDSVRPLRRELQSGFYEIYTACFFNAQEAPSIPRAVSLFFEFGYMSEELLDEEQLAELCNLRKKGEMTPCAVYTIYEWLQSVFSGENLPSRNDMGLDYAEALREMKKRKEITEAEEAELFESKEKRVEFEIKNLFFGANRVTNGQISIFVPVLHKDMFPGKVSAAFYTADRVNAAIERILEIDFSAFHREHLYMDKELGIEREQVMKQVFPQIILLPTVGINGSCWQELTTKKRDSEGRLVLPIFSGNSPLELLVKAVGQFRWLLCKTMNGVDWNNIQYKSLTSEYNDYIQFYKKNNALSDERKEKLKLQISKGRNNLRDIFAMDYEIWIRSESTGGVRLNKIARDILAMYCPFPAGIRENLTKQPIYDEAFKRSNRERVKQAKETELHIKAIEKKGIEVPEILLDTYNFFAKM